MSAGSVDVAIAGEPHSALDVEHRCEAVTGVTAFVNRQELALRGTERTWRF